MKIWLDDIRNPSYLEGEKDSDWVICRTAEECIGLLWLNREPIEWISFDHDLGEDRGTGYDVAKFLEMMAFVDRQGSGRGMILYPLKWSIHSANPVGCKNIQASMEQMKRFLDSRAG